MAPALGWIGTGISDDSGPVSFEAQAKQNHSPVLGFAASRAESLWLSVKASNSWRLRRPRQSLFFLRLRTESQRLSAREAAKPHIKHKVSRTIDFFR